MSSRLLCLPKELRLLIFEYALAHDSPITIGLNSSVPWQGRPQRYHPPLAEVSRLLRQECLPIFYQDRTVVLMLRYREGRQQVQHWLSNIVTDRAICKQVSIVCVQYFEQPHRSTAMLVDVKTFQVSNRESWIHPLLGKPLKTLREVEQELDAAKKEIEPATTYHYVPAFLHELVNLMTVPLSKSRLMLCESMANSRLHGYTDFQLRFEVITIIYSNVG